MKYAFLITVGVMIASASSDTVSASSNDKCDKMTGRDRSRCLMKEREARRDDSSPTQKSTRTPTAPPVSQPDMPRSASPGSSSSPGANVDGTRISITWSPVTGATEYDFGIRDMTNNQLLADSRTGGTSYTTRIEKGRIYRWNVRACNSAGCSGFTAPLYFQTKSSFAAAGATSSSIGSISLPVSFPLYNQHDAANSRLYGSSDWASAPDPAGGPRTNYTCLATVYAMIEHARGNSGFRIGPETWNDQIGALGISAIGASTTIGSAESLVAQFRRGNPVILWGPLSKNSFGHFVLAIGTDSTGQIMIYDPSGGKRVTVDPVSWRVSGGSVLSRIEMYRTVGF